MRTVLALTTWVLFACSPARRRTTVQRGCVVIDETANAPADFRPAMQLDTGLAQAGHGELVVYVRENPGNRALASSGVAVNALTRGVMTDADGLGRLRLPAGIHQVTVRRIAHKAWTDSVQVRAGFVDTVVVGLGRVALCLVY